jgi:hypothetical protein
VDDHSIEFGEYVGGHALDGQVPAQVPPTAIEHGGCVLDRGIVVQVDAREWAGHVEELREVAQVAAPEGRRSCRG